MSKYSSPSYFRVSLFLSICIVIQLLVTYLLIRFFGGWAWLLFLVSSAPNISILLLIWYDIIMGLSSRKVRSSMSGQFNPVASEPDIVWRTVVEHGRYLVAVEAVHGSTRGEGWLNIWDGVDHEIIHRVRTHISSSALLGVDERCVREWEEEVIKAVTNPKHRQVVAAHL